MISFSQSSKLVPFSVYPNFATKGYNCFPLPLRRFAEYFFCFSAGKPQPPRPVRPLKPVGKRAEKLLTNLFITPTFLVNFILFSQIP